MQLGCTCVARTFIKVLIVLVIEVAADERRRAWLLFRLALLLALVFAVIDICIAASHVQTVRVAALHERLWWRLTARRMLLHARPHPNHAYHRRVKMQVSSLGTACFWRGDAHHLQVWVAWLCLKVAAWEQLHAESCRAKVRVVPCALRWSGHLHKHMRALMRAHHPSKVKIAAHPGTTRLLSLRACVHTV